MLLLMSGCQSPDSHVCPGNAFSITRSQLSEQDFDRLRTAPYLNREREVQVAEYFSGCPELKRQAVSSRHGNNILCRIQGTSQDTIVVGAHFDRIGPGPGIADNWSGIVLLSRLLDEIRASTPGHTWLLIAFAGEESMLAGSLRFVKDNNLDDVTAMLNVDTLGLGYTRIDNRSDPQLRCTALALASSLGIDVRRSSLPQTTGDWEPFRSRGIPVLNLHSLVRQDLKIVHTRKDTFKRMDHERFADAWQLVLNLQQTLDDQIPEQRSPR